jgi:ABC-type glycerol-3-phosphate transport system substrate-binding protein
MTTSRVTRRRFLRNSAAASTALVAAPNVRRAHAAGSLSVGLWDHWVPGANDACTKVINEWAAKEKVDVKLDYITSQGNKLLLTTAAEAQAKSGHDILQMGNWLPSEYAKVLEPVDSVIKGLEAIQGPVDPAVAHFGKPQGVWRAVPTTRATINYPCASRIDLLKQHVGLDVTAMYPADGPANKTLTDAWTYDAFLDAAQKCHKAGVPFGLPLGSTGDSVQWVGAVFRAHGAMLVDAKGNIAIKSDNVREVLDYLRRLTAFLPPEVFSWDDASNNKWLISGNGALIHNPPSAWAVAKRDAPKIAEQIWHHPWPKGPQGRFNPLTANYLGVWNFSKNKPAAMSLLHHLSLRDSAERMVAASQGFDLATFTSFANFAVWAEQGPPKGSIKHYPNSGDQQYSMAAEPAPAAIAQQIYSQALMPRMVGRIVQGKDSVEATIDWASRELEGYMRA